MFKGTYILMNFAKVLLDLSNVFDCSLINRNHEFSSKVALYEVMGDPHS